MSISICWLVSRKGTSDQYLSVFVGNIADHAGGPLIESYGNLVEINLKVRLKSHCLEAMVTI